MANAFRAVSRSSLDGCEKFVSATAETPVAAQQVDSFELVLPEPWFTFPFAPEVGPYLIRSTFVSVTC